MNTHTQKTALSRSDIFSPNHMLFRIFFGICIGLLIGCVISIFRITTDLAYNFVLAETSLSHRTLVTTIVWIFTALAAGLVVGRLIRNSAISFGGEDWIRQCLKDGQAHAWRKILLPKFIGSWLVMACCISVGREGPCIEMGCATAAGMKRLDASNAIETRHYLLVGCASGLAAAFSAPFAGICYVYEIMKEKLDGQLFIFLLAGGFGVYLSCAQLFGLGVMLPCGQTPMPNIVYLWTLIPLGLIAGLVGIAYNYLLRYCVKLYAAGNIIPLIYRPLFAFAGAAIMALVFPVITGEGLGIFGRIFGHSATLPFLCLFIGAKLLFTAFCYGSFIPAGLMVPIICLGGVAGGAYADILQALGLATQAYEASFVVMGMAGAFAAAERAPVTALVLIAEMTGAWSASPGMLPVAAIAAYLARLARVETV